jgi:Na+-driven multidrug efflux pump
VISGYLAGAKRPEWNSYVGGVGAILTILLSILLIPRHGAVGAAIRTSAAYLGAALVAITGFLRVSGLGIRELLAFKASDWASLGHVFGISLGGKR